VAEDLDVRACRWVGRADLAKVLEASVTRL
jgi:hypothetical protein